MKQALRSAVRRAHHVAFRRPLPERVAIYFHAVEPHQRERFRECLAFLRDRDYAFVDAPSLCVPDGGRRAFLSFDDNYRGWLDLLPSLEALGVRATFFVNSGPLRDRATPTEIESYFDRIRYRGSRVTLAGGEVRAIAEAGHTIGCHTRTHLRLSALPRRAWPQEIDAAARELSQICGRPVLDFAYPFGMRRHFSRTLRSYCLARGFRSVSNAIPGMQFAPRRPGAVHRSPWHLERSLAANLEDLRVDGRLFAHATGRAAV